MKKEKKPPYVAPEVYGMLMAEVQSIICNSPQPGQIEEIQYEDWLI